MDRRNGGDPLAPPRPPKLLPKIHRPRAPEPEMMNQQSAVATTTVRQTEVSNTTPQCTNHQTDLSRNNNLIQQQQAQQQQQQQQQQQISINQTLSSSTIPISSSAAVAAASSGTSALVIAGCPPIRYNRVNCNNNHIGNIDVITQQPSSAAVATASSAIASTAGLADDYQIHHLTYLPQRPSNLSRNGSQISSNSTTTNTSTTSVGGVSSTASTATTNNGIIAANSFTRRRPPPPPTPVATSPVLGNSAAVPLLTAISGNHHHLNNNFLNHFHTTEQVSSSTVTLAQPRPESERLGNEYVDTPLRTAQQLQNATRIQHPAGEHDNGQTTTHHLLLLPQRELRQQQQHQVHHHHHQQQTQRHATSAAGSATSALPLGLDGTDGILHSQHHHHQQPHKGSTTTSSSSVTGKLSPSPADARGGFGLTGLQPINQPITKQPALSSNANSCKFAKELPALDELLDMHNIATGIPTSQGMISAVNGASPLTGPMVIGGSEGPSSLNPITCPRCERCRCEQCQSPRPLPQTWVCNKTCLCSAESIIDYASCLCCAKALFYHCARDNDMDCDDGSGTPCVDNPCSCGPYKRTQRWGWLGALSLVLPCLWCYWPMRACVAACEKCYGRFARRGCRCQQIGSTSSMFPITSIGNNGNNVMVLSNGGGGGGGGMQGNGSNNSKSSMHHHNECNSAANRILRKGDLTPEKRLLDSSPEY
ncbi:protein sprouty [Musca vetustissima]|uniref:protein sprouty n=1 Tax=Musca vetustissima TaxID=27455 RepID=UPI002AB5F78F|nr:protein sprouty [Musca vetustissima]